MKPDIFAAWMSATGGRKFLLTVGCGLVNALLVFFHAITSHDFVLVTGLTVAAYITGNTYQAVRGVPDAPKP